MLFAVTDIETTGSYATGNSIIEIAVCVFDGKQVVREYQTLLDPGVRLPSFITSLTGISDEMLKGAPTFSQIADELEEVLDGTIFVAHNVAFDYSFIKAEFAVIGRQWSTKRLCTVRLARKAFPGNRSYSLGSLCTRMNITNETAHRAMGDARAALEVLERCMKVIDEKDLQKMVSRASGIVQLPPNLDKSEFDSLPEETGVYFLLDETGKPLYIGKATNLKKRVMQHFTTATDSKRNQDFMRKIHHLSYERTGSELIALLVEDFEIRKHWPPYNKAQKKKAQAIHVIRYLDRAGYERLALQIGNKFVSSIKSFSALQTARNWLMDMASEFKIDMRLLGLDMFDIHAESESADEHNRKLDDALTIMLSREPSLIIQGEGRYEEENSYIVVRNGKLKGYCFLHEDINSEEAIEDSLHLLPPTETNESIIARACEIELYRRQSHHNKKRMICD